MQNPLRKMLSQPVEKATKLCPCIVFPQHLLWTNRTTKTNRTRE